MVDLDGAKDGTLANFKTIEALTRQGGLLWRAAASAPRRIRQYLDLGVGRCILGTIAVKDFDFTARMAQKYGDRIAVGVDARDGYVAVNGWKDLSAERGVDFCRRLHGGRGGRDLHRHQPGRRRAGHQSGTVPGACEDQRA